MKNLFGAVRTGSLWLWLTHLVSAADTVGLPSVADGGTFPAFDKVV
ncbi:MAG: hypothetical protein R3F28_16845 [Candidatus Kapaibacterium sp.]|nr:hypothetical protein [Ignavibacteria bacterium]